MLCVDMGDDIICIQQIFLHIVGDRRGCFDDLGNGCRQLPLLDVSRRSFLRTLLLALPNSLRKLSVEDRWRHLRIVVIPDRSTDALQIRSD